MVTRVASALESGTLVNAHRIGWTCADTVHGDVALIFVATFITDQGQTSVADTVKAVTLVNTHRIGWTGVVCVALIHVTTRSIFHLVSSVADTIESVALVHTHGMGRTSLPTIHANVTLILVAAISILQGVTGIALTLVSDAVIDAMSVFRTRLGGTLVFYFAALVVLHPVSRVTFAFISVTLVQTGRLVRTWVVQALVGIAVG